MQIPIRDKPKTKSRVDFFGNSINGVVISLVDESGMTYYHQKLTEQERLRLINTLTRTDDGGAV